MLTRLAAIATIAALVLALVAYVWPRAPADSTTGAQPAVTQSANDSSGQTTLLNNVNGPITIINNAAPSPPNALVKPAVPRLITPSGPVDIAGVWSPEKASGLALTRLRAFKWRAASPALDDPVEHTSIGQYSLLYRTREGMVVAFASITRGSDCHACAPQLSFFEFEKRIEGWKLIGSYVAVAHAGAWGEAPKLSATHVADDRFGVLIESGYMAQGWSTTAARLFVRMGDSFQEVFKTTTAQSRPDGASWGSTFAFKPSSTGLYDIDVVRKGQLRVMDGDPSKMPDIADASGSVRPNDAFKFDGQSYRRAALVR